MPKRTLPTKFDTCFSFKNDAVKVEFQNKVKADPMCTRMLDERATKLKKYTDWRDSLDFLTRRFEYKPDGTIDWRNTSGVSGEYIDCKNKKPRYSMSDLLLLMLSCTETSAWGNTEAVLAGKVFLTFHSLYEHYFGVRSHRTQSSFAGQGQLLIKYKKEQKLDDAILVLQEENDDLTDAIEAKQKEQDEDRDAFDQKEQQFEEAKRQFQHREALRAQEISDMKADLEAKLQEFQKRLASNEETTEALKISEEKRVVAENLAYAQRMELAEAEAQSGKLVEAVAMCVPGILKAAGTIREMQHTASGKRALIQSGDSGLHLVNMLTNTQAVGMLADHSDVSTAAAAP